MKNEKRELPTKFLSRQLIGVITTVGTENKQMQNYENKQMQNLPESYAPLGVGFSQCYQA